MKPLTPLTPQTPQTVEAVDTVPIVDDSVKQLFDIIRSDCPPSLINFEVYNQIHGDDITHILPPYTFEPETFQTNFTSFKGFLNDKCTQTNVYPEHYEPVDHITDDPSTFYTFKDTENSELNKMATYMLVRLCSKEWNRFRSVVQLTGEPNFTGFCIPPPNLKETTIKFEIAKEFSQQQVEKAESHTYS